MADDKTATVGAVENQQGQEDEKDEKKVEMTEAEFNKKLQVEGDKRADEAIKTHKSKWEKDIKKQIEQERADAEKLAQLSAEEREKALHERNKEELSVKEKLLNQREMKLAAIDILAEEKLPVSFADQLIGNSVEDTHDRIQKFKKAWYEAIEAEVKERLKGVVPPSGETKPEALDMNAYIRRMAGRK